MQKKKFNVLLCVICLLSILVVAWGCTSTTPTSTAPTSTAPATSPVSETKTVKVVMNLFLGWPLGMDQLHATQIDVDNINAAGGLDIGGTKYKIDLIVYDDKNDEALAKSNTQKAIFEDKASFIIGGIFCVSVSIPLVEANDVVFVAWPSSNIFRSPDIKHSYNGSTNDTNQPIVIPYARHLFPDAKTYLLADPDDEQGRGYAVTHPGMAANVGFTVLPTILYPPGSTDLSAVGTKIKALDPDILECYGGGPQLDAQAFKAAYDAGWRGQVIGAAAMPAATLIGIAGPEPVEGLVALAWPAEFEPATYPAAVKWKADYTAEFGKWDDPEMCGGITWWVLKAGLQQAGSIEPAKVRAALDSGIKFDTIGGPGQMIARPDFGVTRTMESILGEMPMKKIVGGKLQLLDTITMDEAIALWKEGKGIK